MPGREISSDQRNKYHGKILVMYLFVLIDVIMNTALDYDILNNHITTNIRAGLLGLQVVVQISIFLILFLATTDTFLFHVGLLGILLQSMRYTLLMHLVYIIFTVITGTQRNRHFTSDYTNNLASLWHQNDFVILSAIHKMS